VVLEQTFIEVCGLHGGDNCVSGVGCIVLSTRGHNSEYSLQIFYGCTIVINCPFGPELWLCLKAMYFLFYDVLTWRLFYVWKHRFACSFTHSTEIQEVIFYTRIFYGVINLTVQAVHSNTPVTENLASVQNRTCVWCYSLGVYLIGEIIQIGDREFMHTES
jgi:hypothetical protein